MAGGEWCAQHEPPLRIQGMKTPASRAGETRKGNSAKSTADDARERAGRAVPKTIRDWAKQRVKKSPVDTDEGGSGQP
jgi:hypothetical protein